MPTQALPESEDIQSVLQGLLGRQVTVSPKPSESIDLTTKIVVGCYERDDGKIGGLVVADLSAAAYAGAALSLLPVGVAKESIDAGTIEDLLFENFQEVLNVGVRWFTAKGNPRVVLSQVYPTDQQPPNDVRLVMAAPNDRLEVYIDVAGYGKGCIRFLAMDY